MMICGNKIQMRKRDQHTGNAAAGALIACHQTKRAGNPDFRYRSKYEIENPCAKDDQVFFQHPKETFLHGNYC